MRGARRCWVLLLVLSFVQAAGVMPAEGAPGVSSPQGPAGDRTIGIKLLDAPESRRADPRAHAYIIDHLATPPPSPEAVTPPHTTIKHHGYDRGGHDGRHDHCDRHDH